MHHQELYEEGEDECCHYQAQGDFVSVKDIYGIPSVGWEFLP